MLALLLAETMPPSVELAGWIGCAFFLAAGINQVMKLTDRFREKPSTTELQQHAHAAFATKAELERHESDDLRAIAKLAGEMQKVDDDTTRQFDELADKMQEMERRLTEAGSKRAGVLHERLDRLAVGLATIGGRMGVKIPREEGQV